VQAGVEQAVRDVEGAFVAQWSEMGRWPGARLVEERGLLRFETPLRRLPYNGVIRTVLDGDGDADAVIAGVLEAHARRGADLFWLVAPSGAPGDLAARLAAAGVPEVEAVTGMYLDLDGWSPRGRDAADVRVDEVADEAGLAAYEDLMMRYWELPEDDREQIVRLSRHLTGERASGRRWIGRIDGRPVAKGYLSLAGPPGVGAIYGMSVLPEARGRGIAGALTDILIGHAAALGCRRVVLHSSAMAQGVYRRAGFAPCCDLAIHATAAIWSGDH
jgi:ribosomal protein S18 acetylase RimI-like enzyme